MLTITNNLPTHIVVPNGAGDGVALKVPPRGQVRVERVTATLKEAERKGVLIVGYPEEPGVPKSGQKRKETPKATE